MNSLAANLLGVFAVSLAWGFGGPASYYVTRSLTASEATFGRCAIAFLGLLPFLIRHGRKILPSLPERGRLLLVASGITLGVHFYFFVSGVAYASLATAVMLVAVEPVLILAVGVLAFHEKLSRQSLLSMILCLAGICVISVLPHWSELSSDLPDPGAPSTRGLGDLAAVLAIVSYAFYYWLNRSFKRHEEALAALIPGSLVRGFSLASVIYGFAALSSGILCLALKGHEPAPGLSPSGSTALGLVALGFIPTIVGHTLSQIVSRRAHPIWVSLMSPGETLMSLLIGFLFLNQNPGATDLAGGALIAMGVGLAIHAESRSG